MRSVTIPRLLCGLLLVLSISICRASEDDLALKLLPLITAHKGVVAVSVKNLRTGETFSHRADEPMPTASLIKFPVMIEAYRQAEQGSLSLDTLITLTNADKVPGSGILTEHFSEEAKFPTRDVIRLMIRYSDNTATNLILDKIGIGSTATTMEKLGCPNTKIHSKVFRRDTSVFPERSKIFGLGSTSASEMVKLLEALDGNRLVSESASQAMKSHMLTCDDHDSLPRFLPPGTKIAFKTGAVNASRTAAGILETPQGAVAICVLTDKNDDQRWVSDNAGTLLSAEIAREIFSHYGGATDSPR